MSAGLILFIVGIVFLIVLLSGFPLAFTLGGLGVVFAATLWGNPGALNLFIASATTTCVSNVYVAVPLFIFMGAVIEASGSADDLFESMYIIFGKIRGGIAITTVVMCTLLAAASGVIGASLTVMTMLALPSMMKYRYDLDLSTGTIMSAGCLGAIIPPSIVLVVYGGQAQISIGKLFAGGVGAGLLLSGIYLLYIIIRVTVSPSSATAIDPEEAAKYSTSQKLSMVLTSILPTLLLVFLVLGSIMFGWATPTEASALGCVGAISLAIINRKLSWKLIKECCFLTAKTNTMVMFIVLTASMFTSVFLGLGGGDVITEVLTGIAYSKWVVLTVILLLLLIMGMFMDSFGVLLIGIPVFTPIAYKMGFSPVWFGIIFAVLLQASYLSPPFAYAAFYVKGTATAVGYDIPIIKLYKSALTFLGLQILAIIIMCIFPEIIIWLPEALFGE